LSALLVYVHANTKRESKDRCRIATVVSVDKQVPESNYAGGSPSDAPLQAEDYDIGIRLNCNIYIDRYESATDYLPSVFSPKQSVDVRLQKHVMLRQPIRDRSRGEDGYPWAQPSQGRRLRGQQLTSERDCGSTDQHTPGAATCLTIRAEQKRLNR
jgi:hypothetical protein